MRRHAFDPVSLIFGTIFAGVGLTFLFGTVDLAALPPAWSWPIPLIIVGALIILLAVRRDRAYAPSDPAQQVHAADPFGEVGPEPTEPIEPVGAAAVATDDPPAGIDPDATAESGTVNLPDGSTPSSA